MADQIRKKVFLVDTEAVDVSELTRKEKKKLQLRQRLDKRLDAMHQVAEENKADPTKPRQRTSLTGFWRKRKEAAKCCVFIGNMPLDITAGELRDHFAPVGRVAALRWLPAGTFSCMAYANFETPELAAEAVNLPPPTFRGHALRINGADDREQRNAAKTKRSGEIEKAEAKRAKRNNVAIM